MELPTLGPMTIRVLGAGMGRTGTKSLQAAFEKLGYAKCHHMVELLRNPAQAKVWMAAYRGEAVDWQALLADYQATTDWPACRFYAELLREYPDAKVVLTVRDRERWYESVRETIYPWSTQAPAWFVRLIPPLHALRTLSKHNIWEGEFGGRFEDREHALTVFDAHIEAVQREVPADQLLVYSVEEGWEPLCQFLGHPVPTEPFPHLNERQQLQRALRVVKGAALVAQLGAAALVGWLSFVLLSGSG